MATATKKDAKTATVTEKVKENLYQAEYVGSGTFIITKPKRNRAKLNRSRVRNRKAGMRK